MLSGAMKKKKQCAAPDCENKFTPKVAWQKYCSIQCLNRELQRRARVKAKKQETVTA